MKQLDYNFTLDNINSFIESGENLDETFDQQGHTALTFAVSNAQVLLVQRILEKGATATQTAKDIAQENSFRQIKELLEPKVVDKYNPTAPSLGKSSIYTRSQGENISNPSSTEQNFRKGVVHQDKGYQKKH